MADYTTTAKIKQRLGPYYDALKLTDVHIGALVTQASGEVDGLLARVYTVPFNAIGDTPATPELVTTATEARALYLCLEQLAVKGDNSALTPEMEQMDARFSDGIAMLRSEDFQLAPEFVSGETVTFAGSSRKEWDVQEFEAIIANGSLNPMTSHQTNYMAPNILEEGLRISSDSTPATGSGLTGAQLALFPRGDAFDIRFDTRRHRWVLTVSAPELREAETLKIDYPWDYRRKTALSARTRTRLALA